jgi:30S ribosomal protein S31
MGRGDKRSKKGKRTKGSFGNSRRHKPKKTSAPVVIKAKPVQVEEVVEKAPAKKPKKKKA